MTSATLKQVATGQQAEPQRPYEALKRQLESSKAEFLPLFGGSRENVDKFIRVVLNAVLNNPDLLAADRRSLIASCMKAAQDGLMPDGRESVLNIYGVTVKTADGREQWVQQVQYLPMVGGLIKNLYASGEILTLDAAVVFENDKFRWVRGDEPKLEHEPTLADHPGNILAAYCVVKLKSGEFKREVMPWRDIERVRAMSKAGSGPNAPWVKWLDQQCIKSVIKRIYKQLPKAERFEQVDRSDNEALGFAATPESVADITARHAALPHTQPEPMDFGTATDARVVVPVGNAAADEQYQHHQPTGQQQRTEPPAFDIEAFARRLQACASLDALDVMADDIRGVADAAARQQLNQVYERRAAELRDPGEQQSRQATRQRPEPTQAVSSDPFSS
jgi:phage RecT family recombinase